MSTKSISNFCQNVVNFVSSSAPTQKSVLLTAGLVGLISLPFVARAGKDMIASLYSESTVPIHGCPLVFPSKLFPLTSSLINQHTPGQIRDTLVVWGKLASQIGVTVHLQDNITIPEQFSSWMTEHENALNQIEELDISNCSLTTLLPQLGQLINLKELDLSDNQLTTLPSEMSQLSQLRYLNLSRNQFKTLPSVVGQCGKLESLYLQENRLTSLPSEIGNLSHLEILDLSWNELSEIPLSLAALSGNCHLSALGNQFPEKTTEDFQNQIDQIKKANPDQGPRAIISSRKDILTLRTF